ncbi:MAG: hypothetical protein U0703_14045 [Anaerolineae bacterium]
MAAAFMLRNTRLGRYTYAIGSNETVARLGGVDVDGRETSSMRPAAAGIAGWITPRHRGGTFNSGENYELRNGHRDHQQMN